MEPPEAQGWPAAYSRSDRSDSAGQESESFSRDSQSGRALIAANGKPHYPTRNPPEKNAGSFHGNPSLGVRISPREEKKVILCVRGMATSGLGDFGTPDHAKRRKSAIRRTRTRCLRNSSILPACMRQIIPLKYKLEESRLWIVSIGTDTPHTCMVILLQAQ